jgi:hypothetical protein
MTGLELDGLSRRYGDTVALDGLGFEVQEGRLFGFAGPNGAVGLALGAAAGQLDLSADDLGALGLVLAWFVLGYGFYSCAFWRSCSRCCPRRRRW